MCIILAENDSYTVVCVRMRRMQELDALFVEFDRDGNGQIDRTEMEALVLHIFGGIDAVETEEYGAKLMPLFATGCKNVIVCCLNVHLVGY